jgi:hypothetical protein
MSPTAREVVHIASWTEVTGAGELSRTDAGVAGVRDLMPSLASGCIKYGDTARCR